MKTTKGKYMVGAGFNPSAYATVDEAKKRMADFIDWLETVTPLPKDDMHSREVARLKAMAQRAAEDAAMYATKMLTKPAYHEDK